MSILLDVMTARVKELVKKKGEDEAARKLKKEIGKELTRLVWQKVFGKPPPFDQPKVPSKPDPVVVENGKKPDEDDGTAPVDVVQPPPGTDAIDLSNAKSLGRHAKVEPKKATITRKMISAKQEGSKVRIEFEPLDWPSKTGSNGKTTDGGVYIYWVAPDGKVIGGFFDHHGKKQTLKVLDNIPAGYLDGQCPADGTEVYFGIVSYDGKERTNFVKCSNTWKSFE